MKRKILSILAVLALTLSLNSCKKDEATGTGYIQFTNVSELSSPLDFYVSDVKKTNTALAYTQSSPYFEVSAKKDQAANIKVAANGQSVINFNATPQNGVYYSVYYFSEGTVIACEDDLTAPTTGKAKVRFLNLNLAPIAAYDFGIASGAKLVTKLKSGNESTYYNVEPNTTFAAYVADSTAALINIPTTIAANRIYTIVLSGQDSAARKATVILQK